MTTTNLRPADALRAALKAAGFNARRVSVRADNSLLRVTIRDASASLTKVKAIAAPFESVRHCQATGEILAGGNIFPGVRIRRRAHRAGQGDGPRGARSGAQ